MRASSSSLASEGGKQAFGFEEESERALNTGHDHIGGQECRHCCSFILDDHDPQDGCRKHLPVIAFIAERDTAFGAQGVQISRLVPVLVLGSQDLDASWQVHKLALGATKSISGEHMDLKLGRKGNERLGNPRQEGPIDRQGAIIVSDEMVEAQGEKARDADLLISSMGDRLRCAGL
ncbi:hypothetical protein GWK36_12465 [Caldichromatium japonicum]|uniref:Uncharacterized protein n=1 Tax=Caldichromatium japonicum TaxID=2699430 RepID=A0A6G7VF64_9GAMM|nr:hypothetical protein [Caldichromatium japonicum]QIK38661.1 hypothetical protein GWK36_12465 [Caldichromatium japonicum]